MLNRVNFVSYRWGVLALLLFSLFVTAPAEAIKIGTEPPDFELTALTGERVRLTDYRGQAIILKFATTWCSGCKRQDKEFAAVGAYLVENDIVLIEIFVDKEPESVVREYLQQRKLDLPTVALIDDGSVARAYRLLGIPWVLLIDKDFKVQRERGLITASDLQGQLQKMLGK
jgi:peroxiredoxin